MDSGDMWRPPVGDRSDRRSEALGDLRVIPDETLCAIIATLAPRDVARLACVSSVMYILCNEEPLWMSLCLRIVNRQLQYKDSWKKTTLHQLDLLDKYNEGCKHTLCFDGFNSLFLYRRLYRCYTSLSGFSFDDGNVDRRDNISTLELFCEKYDGQKPVLISGLADNWPARKSWTIEQLLLKYPDAKFRISQRSTKKISMKLKDYIYYMQQQHDEDPLYVFDDKFGEVAPDLLKDYTVPHLFQEDYFDILDIDQRPPYKWLIIGPERSGASWHVDPGLTSAWNTLLCGRKRWALYPPGRVPSGVTVHVNEDDGDVNIETPSSLQWWLDYYPLLADDDKPIECTQLPGETIYVPTGWWHCVLNLETTIAVTQNFVNSKNFEFVCLDMAPGYRHKGICRAGLLALGECCFEEFEEDPLHGGNSSNDSDLLRKEKRLRICHSQEDMELEQNRNGMCKSNNLRNQKYYFDVNFLATFVDDKKDHYTSLWSSSNCLGQREMRGWLWKLWVGRPELRDLIWKGACLALNAGKWFELVREVCSFHGLPQPAHDEKLPVGTGSNPVYLVDDSVIKIFVEGGLEASLYGLGTELQFHNLLHELNNPLKNYIPPVLASGLLVSENGSHRVLPWDGSSIPESIGGTIVKPIAQGEVYFPFGIWNKKQFELRNAGKQLHETGSCGKSSSIWPFIITRRSEGNIFAELRDTLSSEDALNLAYFLGEQLRNLHELPVPYPNPNTSIPIVRDSERASVANPDGWNLCISILNRKRKDVSSRLSEWGDPIPCTLIEKVEDYVPHKLTAFYDIFENETELSEHFAWIHSDIMDDNIYMRPFSEESTSDYSRDSSGMRQNTTWCPSRILDFSDLSLGDPLLDLIPIYLDIFRGDSMLLKQFLSSYKLPFLRKKSLKKSLTDNRFGRLSYRAMCHCILHDENVLGAIFSIWKELRTATAWEEVEERVWGDLNDYWGF